MFVPVVVLYRFFKYNIHGGFINVFGESVRELRNRLRLNQIDFGVRIGVSQQVIHKWEAERNNPDPKTISHLG